MLFFLEEQAQFNKFVREEVSKKFGDDFLLEHEVNQLESSMMELIKGIYYFFINGNLVISIKKNMFIKYAISRRSNCNFFAKRYNSS